VARQKVGTAEGGIRVEGLNELVARLKVLEAGSEVAVRLANKEAATFVTAGARAAASALGGVAAHAAPSLKASAGVKSAGVALGGGDHPEALGAEFGGGRRPTTQQFKPWLGHTGYFLYPVIRRDHEKIDETYRAALDKIIKEAGLD